MRLLAVLASFVLAFPPAPTAVAVPLNVGNRVWHDEDADGIQDAGEPGIEGVTVQLLTADRRQLLDQTTTNETGSYTLSAESPGAFRIRVIPPPGWEITRMGQGTDDTADSDVHPFGPDFRYSDPILAAPNVVSLTLVDVGLTQPSGALQPVGNFVWNDLDGDGVQDGGEPGVAGVTVELWNAAKTQRLAVTTTSVLGIYALPAPGGSLVRVRVIPPPGMELTSPDVADDDTDSDFAVSGPDRGFTEPFFASGSVLPIHSKDAGLLQPVDTGSIVGHVWSDDDGDGVQDVIEFGIAGVTVELWNAARKQLIATLKSKPDGSYAIPAPRPGGFQIRVVAPPGYQYTRAHAVPDDLVDSDVGWDDADAGWSGPFFLSSTTSTRTIDAGLVQPGPETFTIGDRVWLDLDFDGIAEAGEASVQGVTVELWDAPKRHRIASATTDATGLYSLPAPRPGYYRLRVPLEATSGIAFTRKDATGDATDSDVHPYGEDYGFSDVILMGETSGTTLWDVGLLPQLVPEPGASGSAAALLALAAIRLRERAARARRAGRRA